MGLAIGLGDRLVEHPELENDPRVASQTLAAFLKRKELPIRDALSRNDLVAARRLVDGGSSGLGEFVDAFTKGDKLIPQQKQEEIRINMSH